MEDRRMNHSDIGIEPPLQPSPVTIREMEDRDVATYCTLFKQVFSEAPWNENHKLADIETMLQKVSRKKGFGGLVAESGSEAVGYLTGYLFGIPGMLQLYYIDQLFMSQEFRKKGIGGKLLAEMTGRLKNFRISGIILLTMPHSAAEKFYIRNGYRKVPVIKIRGKSILYIRLRDRIREH
jgi:GNAT superfamily N-acetyltransferase